MNSIETMFVLSNVNGKYTEPLNARMQVSISERLFNTTWQLLLPTTSNYKYYSTKCPERP